VNSIVAVDRTEDHEYDTIKFKRVLKSSYCIVLNTDV